eukprot:TRINITY_DN18411_c0_g1_i1.p1 TRINITY_DN18411_c0_g1~~TRINITY_DN18411_c0_g1_i1.p1  ORF type:complete len:144 (-),score=30.78 TRINITY_DN18411_c0_g1_i1:81-512(-)
MSALNVYDACIRPKDFNAKKYLLHLAYNSDRQEWKAFLGQNQVDVNDVNLVADLVSFLEQDVNSTGESIANVFCWLGSRWRSLVGLFVSGSAFATPPADYQRLRTSSNQSVHSSSSTSLGLSRKRHSKWSTNGRTEEIKDKDM